MENHSKGDVTRKPGGEEWRARLAKDLAEYNADQKRAWGDIDEKLATRYVLDACTAEEKTRVEKAMEDYPEVRKWVEYASRPDTQSDRDVGEPWTSRANKSGNEPDKTR